MNARARVRWAVQSGRLSVVSKLTCADCGGQAQHYHHYLGYEAEHALDVIPLCRPCHVSRHRSVRTTWPVWKPYTGAVRWFLDQTGRRHTWFAEKLGVSQWMFNHIEAGRRNPPTGYYERAAEILQVPVEMLRPPEPESVAV